MRTSGGWTRRLTTQRAKLENRRVSTDPGDYNGAPDAGAYITVEATRQTGNREYRYYYWQWREGDSQENEYIAPVSPKRELRPGGDQIGPRHTSKQCSATMSSPLQHPSTDSH